MFTTLASAPLTVTENQTYNLRLEAVGTRPRGFVTNHRRLEAIDSNLRHGQAALLTYRTQASFDNLLFDTTKKFFESWLSQLANNALIAILTGLIAALMLSLG